MILMLTLVALGAVTVSSVVVYQRGARRRLLEGGGHAGVPALPPARHEPAEDGPAEDVTLSTLGPGDVIIDGGADWLIVGTLYYKEERDRWQLHRVQGEDQHRWFEVRQRDGLVAAWFEPASDIPSFGQLYDGLTHRGLPFRLVRRGDAYVSKEGDVDGRAAGLVRYTTYEGPGGMYLNVEEAEGSERRALTGDRVIAAGLMLMPGEPLLAEEPPYDDDPEEGLPS